MYYIYILLCEGNTLYTGITKDLSKRMTEHFLTLKTCAKFTRSHKPEKIVGLFTSPDRSTALKLEYKIKSLHKNEKEALINNPENVKNLSEIFTNCAPANIPPLCEIIKNK